MNRLFLTFLKVLLTAAAVALFLLTLAIGAAWYLQLPDSDGELVRRYFDPQLPGYSDIEIIAARGAHRVDNPRFVVVEATLESYPEPVTCRAQIRYVRGDPSITWIGWDSWECVGHQLLVWRAREALSSGMSREPCRTVIEDAALVLYRWVAEGWIAVDEIRYSPVRKEVERLLGGEVPLPSEPATLFDVAEVQIHDLSPELPEEEKVPTYVLRCDGTLELYFRGGPRWWDKRIEYGPHDTTLSTPVPGPRAVGPSSVGEEAKPKEVWVYTHLWDSNSPGDTPLNPPACGGKGTHLPP